MEVIIGVERSVLAAAHPSAWWAAARGLLLAPSNPFTGAAQQTGLPADFLVDSTGVIAAVHYGSHANDPWSVEDVLALSAGVH